jgi:group II intron reverse transcriptase/maturase
VETKLAAISVMAREGASRQFISLAYLLNEAFLARCFERLRKEAASGIDGVSYQEYAENLSENLAALVRRMKAWQYRPQPVRRVWIPKDEHSRRPLGIPAVEDKIVQLGITRILEAIYEADFLAASYGFRPGRGCHRALEALDKSVMAKPTSYVVEADIKGFFDSVDHKLLMACLRRRIGDTSLLRLIGRFLRAGVLEEGQYMETERGTPQGGVLSPMLANIYLHYLLDLWFEGNLKQSLNGHAELVRYADDFVICVQNHRDAERILRAIGERCAKGGLELSQEKTRLVEFGRFAADRTRLRGEKPGTFDFLGFTHYCDTTRNGRFKVGRKTSRKKLRQKLKAITGWLRRVRHVAPVAEWWSMLRVKLVGHYRYYGVSGNYPGIRKYYTSVVRLAWKWLNRRSQRRSCGWEDFHRYLERYPLPKPRIYRNLYTLSLTRGA